MACGSAANEDSFKTRRYFDFDTSARNIPSCGETDEKPPVYFDPTASARVAAVQKWNGTPTAKTKGYRHVFTPPVSSKSVPCMHLELFLAKISKLPVFVFC